MRDKGRWMNTPPLPSLCKMLRCAYSFSQWDPRGTEPGGPLINTPGTGFLSSLPPLHPHTHPTTHRPQAPPQERPFLLARTPAGPGSSNPLQRRRRGQKRREISRGLSGPEKHHVASLELRWEKVFPGATKEKWKRSMDNRGEVFPAGITEQPADPRRETQTCRTVGSTGAENSK